MHLHISIKRQLRDGNWSAVVEIRNNRRVGWGEGFQKQSFLSFETFRDGYQPHQVGTSPHTGGSARLTKCLRPSRLSQSWYVPRLRRSRFCHHRS